MPDRAADQWNTPLYQQYWKLKDEVPGCILFFRLGDFFELFGEDAHTAAPLMEVQITSRDKSRDAIPMCGVPAHAWENYADKLLVRGFKVALVEQVEAEPHSEKKKLVDRRVVRILTPGLPVDPLRVDAKSEHYLAVIGGTADRLELIYLDFLGQRRFAGDFTDSAAFKELFRGHPVREIVYAGDLDLEELQLGFLFKENGGKICAWARGSAENVLKEYLAYTQRWSQEEVANFLPPAESLFVLQGGVRTARISGQVLEQWNIYPELFEFLDGCGSAAGSRELRKFLGQPLARAEDIVRRQELLAELPVNALYDQTKNLYDLERLLGRVAIRAATPTEFLRVRDSLRVLKNIDLILQDPWAKKLDALADEENLSPWSQVRSAVIDLEVKFSKTFCETPVASPNCRDLIAANVCPEFDRLKNLHSELEVWLQEFETKLKAETQITNLKVRFNRINGFYIEVSKGQLGKIPNSFVRRQTLVNAERFSHPDLQAREEEILGAEDKLERQAKLIVETLAIELRDRSRTLAKALRLVSFLDALVGAERGLKKSAVFGSWALPQIQTGDFFFEIEDGRHPLIEFAEKTFVPNSVALGVGKKRMLLLTGPNMAGKSTLMRQTGIILLLAQLGFRVPAQKCILAPANGFYSRMGAADRILEGESTFMVEMREMAIILRDADRNSFVLIDEIGRGTSTRDGLALAQAFLEHFAQKRESLTFFATHYHELAHFSEKFPQVLVGSMSIREWKGDLIFLRKLIFEAASSSYGLHVAKLAGISIDLLARAKLFYRQHGDGVEGSDSLPLFPAQRTTDDMDVKIFEKLESLDLDSISPKKAWTLLEEWKDSAARESADC